MAENKEITLSFILNEAIKYTKGEATIDDLNKIGEQMIIRTYLPILEKFSSVMLLVFTINQEVLENTEIKTINLYKHMFFDILLGKYTNVKIDDTSLCTYTAYDVLYPIFSKYILQFCEDDYKLFEQMVKDTMNFNNIQEFGELLEKVDYKRLEKANEGNVQALEELKKNQKLIKDLNKLLDNTKSENSKNLEKIVNQIALEKAIEK